MKIATTRDQYVGLKDTVLSTRMNVMGEVEMEGITRWTRTMFVLVAAASVGVKTPSSRNCLTLPMRRREEADGDRSMMGSRRFRGAFCRFATRVEAGSGAGADGLGRLRRKVAAILRYGVKSFHHTVSAVIWKKWA